jgi:Flp pilus assembly protein TadG
VKRRQTAGQVLPLIAVCLTGLLGFAGIGVDVGYLEYRQQAQQTATDAAAIGGAQQLATSNCTNAAGASSSALYDAGQNNFPNGGLGNTVTVQATSPPASGPYAGNTCAVSVQITTQHVATFFSRLFGWTSGMPETTQAVGTVNSNGGACIYLLSTNTWSSFNNPVNVQAPHCPIVINYSADFDGGTIASPYIGYAGPNPNYGGTDFTLASPTKMLQVADPCPEIPGCAYLTANPPPTSNCSGYNAPSGGGTIQAGCYTYLNGNGGTITMEPGVYTITGNMNTNQSSFVGSGVTIYIPSGGNAPQWDNATVNLSPPTTGPEAGVLYYQVNGNSSEPDLNGPNVNISGLIYAPSAQMNIDGNSGTYVVIVAGSANFNGNTAYDVASPPPDGSYIKTAVLGQ